MGQKQSNEIKKFKYDFQYQFITQQQQQQQHQSNELLSNISNVEFSYTQELPYELNGVLSGDEYRTIGDYLKFISGYGKPHNQFLFCFLIVLLLVFIPFVMIVNQVYVQYIVVYIMLSGVITMIASFPYFIYLIYKLIKLKLQVNKILKDRSIKIKPSFKFRGYIFLFMVIFYSQFMALFNWLHNSLDLVKPSIDNQTLILIMRYSIAFDVFILVFFAYNYALFTKWRGILIDRYQVENDFEYINLLNKTITKYMDPINAYLEYSVQPLASSSSSSSLSTEYNSIDLDIESQKLLYNQQYF